ncbi:MAG: MoaD/ThiS family protein [Thermodesulfobacteriota bacterium]
MSEAARASVRLLGCLHTLARERGQPSELEVSLPPEGKRADDVARQLGLPLEKIEAVFCNRVVRELDHVLRPGDRVAFVPRGTPGPHRFTLGIYAAGRGEIPEGEAPR